MTIRVRGKVVVEDRDRGLKRILRAFEAGRDITTTIGIQDPEGSDPRGDINNATIGLIQEFGAPSVGIPERSFTRVPFDESLPQIEKIILGGMRRVIDGTQSVATTYGLAGEFLRGKMIGAIDEGIPPPNAPSTIAAKGSSKPLINLGQLKQSITVKTDKRGRR